MSDTNSNSQTVAAVVVTYNRKELLAQCLDALLSQRRPPQAIYVVDNASSDGTEEMIAARYANLVRYERLHCNLGGSGGFHHGMARAYAGGYDYIWVMEDDVRPEDTCLLELLSARSRSRVLIPLRVSSSGELAEYAATKAIWNIWSLRKFKSGWVGELFENVESLPAALELEDMSFEGPLFHRSVIAAVGLPREDFFIFADDTEYAWRLLRGGCGPCLCVKAARMIRMVPPLPSGSSPWRDYYFCRNVLWLRRAYARCWWMRLAAEVFFFLSLLKQWATGRRSRKEIALRLEAWLDSFRSPMPRKYLPASDGASAACASRATREGQP
jgi:GT2 family glycosyltransferase